MSILFIIDDPPYGTERCYNALRLAGALLRGSWMGIGLLRRSRRLRRNDRCLSHAGFPWHDL